MNGPLEIDWILDNNVKVLKEVIFTGIHVCVLNSYTDNPVLRGHIWDKEKVVL